MSGERLILNLIDQFVYVGEPFKMQLLRCEMPPFYRWSSLQQSNTDVSNEDDDTDALKINFSKGYTELDKSAEFSSKEFVKVC